MGLFRRKKEDDATEASSSDVSAKDVTANGASAEDGTVADGTQTASAPSIYGGPFDVEALDDDRERIDFGAVLVPAVDGMQIRIELDEAEEVAAVSVLADETVLQLQAFAAPRSEGLWDEVRQEIAEGIRASQGRAREADGPFGRELHAEVPVTAQDGAQQVQAVRFIGADGPRWFVRGLISGVGATDLQRSVVVEEIFGGVAVRRGHEAASPREPLPLIVPESPNLLPEDVGEAEPVAGDDDAK